MVQDDSLQWEKKKPTLLELSYKIKVGPQLQLYFMSSGSQNHIQYGNVDLDSKMSKLDSSRRQVLFQFGKHYRPHL